MKQTRRLIPRLPFIALLALLAAVVLQAWANVGQDPLVLNDAAQGIDSITWAGTVREDGTVSIEVTYDFDDDTRRDMDIRLPPGARYLAVNGTALASDIGRYATTTVAGRATVSYELPGRVTRFRDGAILRLAQARDSYLDGDEALFACPRCYIDPLSYGNAVVFGELFLPGATEVELSFIQLQSIRTAADTDSVRFVGINEGVDAVAMVAVLPAESVSALPVRDGSVGDALERVRAELSTLDTPIRQPTQPGGASATAAIVLTALLGAFVVWLVVRVIWIRGAAAARRRAGSPDGWLNSSPVRPGDLSPALAGFVVGDTGRGRQSVVAATILDLIRRDVIAIEGSDARRFVLHIPAGDIAASDFERAVITSLRPINNPSAKTEVAGPNPWGQKASFEQQRLQLALRRQAGREGLVRRNLPLWLVGTLTVSMGVIAIIAGVTVLGWLTVTLGTVLAFLAAVGGGVGLSVKGQHERDQWIPYAAHLRTRSELEGADAPSVHQYGEELVYAAALGGASRVANSLSPMGEGMT